MTVEWLLLVWKPNTTMASPGGNPGANKTHRVAPASFSHYLGLSPERARWQVAPCSWGQLVRRWQQNRNCQPTTLSTAGSSSLQGELGSTFGSTTNSAILESKWEHVLKNIWPSRDVSYMSAKSSSLSPTHLNSTTVSGSRPSPSQTFLLNICPWHILQPQNEMLPSPKT